MSDFNSLKHAERSLPGGGIVLVLDTGAVISPEAVAMLQALHSRSTGGIKEHLEVLKKRGPEKFMETFYVGYGHKSIGDCGTITIFIEGVSMLVAKAVQDWPLYSGQESSTRFLDFSKQRFIDPVGNSVSSRILAIWRSFYLTGLNRMIPVLKERFPRQEGEKELAYEKAIKARACDVMRGFLPAGTSTNLSWHTNLRQAADHIMLLRHHPLLEARQVAETMQSCLLEACPSSFKQKLYEATEQYNDQIMNGEYYYTDPDCPDFELVENNIKEEFAKNILSCRPPKTDLPHWLAECGTLKFRFLLDFGSFRDIQRHRAVSQRMPLITMDHGFAEWYLKELTPELLNEAVKLIRQQKTAIEKLPISPEEKQYYIAMGFNQPNQVTGGLPYLVYLVELRATRFVHPTLRKRARQMAAVMQEKFGEWLAIHLDEDPDRFDVKRGEQDIVKRAE